MTRTLLVITDDATSPTWGALQGALTRFLNTAATGFGIILSAALLTLFLFSLIHGVVK